MSLGLAVLLSGGGTTLQNIVDRIELGELDAKVHCVIGSQRDAYGMVRARNHGIPATAIVRKDYSEAQGLRASSTGVCGARKPCAPPWRVSRT